MAEEVLVSPRIFEIGSEKGWRSLMALLDEPANAEPDAGLVALLARKPKSRKP
jgi:uncharacterized protein (DUF1778 family)